jgi:hypothetical protein
MATRKSAPRKARNTQAASTASSRAAGIPPYGNPIREAIARGDVAEMKKLSVSARKYLSDVQAAIDSLDRALGNSKG